MKSIEEQVEYKVKKELEELGFKCYAKTESVNNEIDAALKNEVSKSGGNGGNYPDIKLLVNDIPIMIEIKGKYEDLIKFDISQGPGILSTRPNHIVQYAVNGANHYARAIVNNSKYENCVAIGITGNKTGEEINLYTIFCKVNRNSQTEIIRDKKELKQLKEIL